MRKEGIANPKCLNNFVMQSTFYMKAKLSKFIIRIADQTLSKVFIILVPKYVVKQLYSPATFEINTVFIASNT